MKYLLICLLFTTSTFAGLVSPFSSTVDGITIPNTHQVSDRILRGMAPLGKIGELINFGVTDILIFKNQTRNEIDQELAEIDKYSDIVMSTSQLDFFWHNFDSYAKACEKTIDALRLMRAVNEDPKRKLFFHCTVGEDRTGYLSGLWKMLKRRMSLKGAFYSEMCRHGYGRGNPNKPAYVVNEIRADLTPLFMYMAKLIEKRKISLGNLTKKFCPDSLGEQKTLKCSVSPLAP